MHYIRFILTCLATLTLMLTACTRSGKGEVQAIRVDVSEDLPADSFLSEYTCIRLDSVTSPMLSEVRDIRFLDSLIFILDDAGRVFTFSARATIWPRSTAWDWAPSSMPQPTHST